MVSCRQCHVTILFCHFELTQSTTTTTADTSDSKSVSGGHRDRVFFPMGHWQTSQWPIGLFAGVQIPALNFYTLGSIISQNVFDRFTSSAVDMTHKCKAERIILLFLLFKIVSFLWNPLNASKIWVVKQTCVLLTTFITVPDVPLI